MKYFKFFLLILLSLIGILLVIQFFNNGCSTDYSSELPGDYVYMDEGGNMKIIFNKNDTNESKNMQSEIIDFDYNNEFIIAVQKPTDIIYFANQKISNYKTDSLLFYIADIPADTLLGPLTVNEYFRLRKAMGIPDDLKLKITL